MVRAIVGWACISSILAIPAAAQGTRTKATPQEYQASADLRTLTLAAEDLGHSIISDAGAYFARDYVVVDLAVFPKGKQQLTLSARQFTLRVNGNKGVIGADSSGAVAASIKYEDWSQRGRLTGGASMGDAGVALGQPRGQPRFPGDPNSRAPVPPKVDTNDPNASKPQEVPLEEALLRASLPEGTGLTGPLSGLIYFPYKGKLSKLKSIELIYSGPYGEATIRLR